MAAQPEACRPAVEAYQAAAARKNDLDRTDLATEKTGTFTGSYAVNPANGEAIPVWIADYVLASYGTGAVMAVPAHDQRDWDFARAMNLPVVRVVEGGDLEEAAWAGDGAHVASGFLDGLDVAGARADHVPSSWCTTGMGSPQYRCRLKSQSRRR